MSWVTLKQSLFKQKTLKKHHKIIRLQKTQKIMRFIPQQKLKEKVKVKINFIIKINIFNFTL